MDIGFLGLGALPESGMMRHGKIRQATASSVGWIFVRERFSRTSECAASSAIQVRGSSPLFGAQKNRLRLLRSYADGLVRPWHAPRARSGLRRHTYLPGVRSTPRSLSGMRRREARAVGFPGGQPVLHQALRGLRRQALPAALDQGRRQGAQARLAHGQGAGQGVHGDSFDEPGRRAQGRSASTRSPIRKGTPTGSW